MGLLHFGGGGEGSGDRRLRGKEGCLVHGGGRGGEGEIGVLLQHGRKMCTRLCSGLWLLLWRSGLVWRSSRGTSLFGGGEFGDSGGVLPLVGRDCTGSHKRLNSARNW